MDNLWMIALEAHNDGRNHHRRYEIEVGRDLFDEWTVTLRYGRVGSGKQQQSFVARDEMELKAIIRDRLRRRRGSAKRIGCDYKVVSLAQATGHSIGNLLPTD